ncbi:Phage tape measure protein [Shewanella benthica]|uniref:Phage tape measure protein n=1 Tax=Shewanella benthica TaxID=43661 RepID=A0A330M491_9GAMM|nr:tape measure protein [Shewanella benthica]SQH76938.1 Phage tape measure protein [Shewanella benthica]
MSFKDQVVNLIIKGKDLFSSEAKKSEKALAELAQQSEILNARLHELEDLQGAVGAIDDLTRAISKGEEAYGDNSVALDKLVKEQKQATAAVKQLDNAHKAASVQTENIEQEYKQAKVELSQYDLQLLSAKTNVDKLTQEQKKGSQASKEQAAALNKASIDLKQLEQAQSTTEASSKALVLALDKQRRELLNIGTAAEEAGRKKAEYTLKVKSSRTELNKLASSLGKNKVALEQQTGKLTAAGYSMDKLADASKDLKQQQGAAEMAIAGVNKKLGRHEKLLKESSKGAKDFGGSIGSATKSLLAMAGAYIGVDRLWESLKGILTAGDRAEAFSTQMSAMMGSIQSGEQATAWIKEFANKTGTRLDSVKNAFASLKTFGIDPMTGALQSMVDYNIKLGGSQEKLEGIILAVGQAWAKQKLQGEEILQLIERGIPVWELLEKVTGKNTVQLQKMSSAGELGRETIKALFDELGRQANGLAAKSLDRLSGQINLISNKFEQFKQIIADSGVYQVAVDFLKDLNKQFDRLNQDGKIKTAAEDISQFFSSIIRDGGTAISTTLENITAFAQAMNVIAGSMRLAWNGITAGISLVAAGATASWALMIEGFALFVESLGGEESAAKIRKASELLNALSTGYLKQLEQDSEDIKAAWGQITGAVENETTTAYKNAAVTATESAKVQVSAAETVVAAGIKQIETLLAQKAAAELAYAELIDGAKKGGEASYLFMQAQNDLGRVTLELSVAQQEQVKNQRLLELSIIDSTAATKAELLVQQQLARQTLVEVRRAFIQGTASVDKYKSAQKSLEVITAKLAVTQKKQTLLQQQQAASAKELELVMDKAGITTVKALRAQEQAAKITYQAIKKGAKEGAVSTYELNQAFLQYAEAAVQAAAASDKQVDASVRQQAAALGLTGDLELVIAQYQRLKEVQKDFGEQTENTKDKVEADSTGIGTTITNTMNIVTMSAKQAGSALGSIAQAFTHHLQAVTAGIAELSEGATVYFKNILYHQNKLVDDSSELEKVRAQYKSLSVELNNIQDSFASFIDFTGIRAFAIETVIAGKKTEVAYLAQRMELLRLTEALDGVGGANLELVRKAEMASRTLALVNDQDMSLLTSAIDKAKDKMDELRGSAKDTLSSLKDELDGLEGDNAAIEKRAYERQLAELNERLIKARQTGDKNLIAQLEESERILKRIHAMKMAEFKAQKEAAQASRQQNDNRQVKPTPAPVNPSPAAKKYTAPVPVATTKPLPSSSDQTVLVLQLGDKQFNTQTTKGIVAELMAEITRQQQVGG